jgi:hypothetical protein
MNIQKICKLLIVCTLTASLLLGTAVSTAKAASGVADGTWSAGAEVNVDLTANPAPYTWLQLLGKGVVVDQPSVICHPFEGGRYGWTADIRQLVGGTWIKVATTQDWVSGEESGYAACAFAPAAGTYALFAYYTRPDEITTTTTTCTYDTAVWEASYGWNEGDMDFRIDLGDDVPAGLTASITVTVDEGYYIGPLSETTTTYVVPVDPYNHYAYFANAKSYDGAFTITLHFTIGACSKDMQIIYDPK